MRSYGIDRNVVLLSNALLFGNRFKKSAYSRGLISMYNYKLDMF